MERVRGDIRLKTILEQLAENGTIVINEKDDEDYTIYTRYPMLVRIILEENHIYYKEVKYNEPDFYFFDFNLREQNEH